MQGVNTSGRPDPANIWLGRGKILLGSISTTTGKPYDFRHVGNCKSLSLNVETETLEHQNSRSGVKVIDREIVLSQKFNLSMVLDELSFNNLAVFFSGSAVAANANPAATASDTDVQIATDALKGHWYEVRQADGDRLLDLKSGAIVVKSGAGAATNTLVLGTDYEVDLKWGKIFLRPEPEAVTFVDGHELYYSYTGGTTGSGTSFERVIDTVDIATQSKSSLFVRYIGINPGNDDQEIMLDLHSVSLRADGDLSLIGDEFSELTLSGVAEKNELGYPDFPVGKAYYHAGA